MSYYIKKISTSEGAVRQEKISRETFVKSSSSMDAEDGKEVLSEGGSVEEERQSSSSAVAGLVRNALKGLKGVSSSLKKVTALAEKASFSGLNSASRNSYDKEQVFHMKEISALTKEQIRPLVERVDPYDLLRSQASPETRYYYDTLDNMFLGRDLSLESLNLDQLDLSSSKSSRDSVSKIKSAYVEVHSREKRLEEAMDRLRELNLERAVMLPSGKSSQLESKSASELAVLVGKKFAEKYDSGHNFKDTHIEAVDQVLAE